MKIYDRIRELSKKYNLSVANCFHAGDGNLHPLIMFDGSKKDELRKTEEFGSEISDSEAEKILTVGDAIKFIESKSN